MDLSTTPTTTPTIGATAPVANPLADELEAVAYDVQYVLDPGHRTTEFWLATLLMAANLALVAFGAAKTGGAPGVLAIAPATAIALVYGLQRTFLKLNAATTPVSK